MTGSERNTRWLHLVNQLRRELTCIDATELQWLQQKIELIRQLQLEIHALFLRADGEQHCTRCLGSCCERGHNHITLINVSAALLSDHLPAADFDRTCPFLTQKGCSLTVGLRPYNCVTFICSSIEEHMDGADLENLYQLDTQLRSHYLDVDQRYAGSSMRGFLIGSARLGDQNLLQRIDLT